MVPTRLPTPTVHLPVHAVVKLDHVTMAFYLEVIRIKLVAQVAQAHLGAALFRVIQIRLILREHPLRRVLLLVKLEHVRMEH